MADTVVRASRLAYHFVSAPSTRDLVRTSLGPGPDLARTRSGPGRDQVRTRSQTYGFESARDVGDSGTWPLLQSWDQVRTRSRLVEVATEPAGVRDANVTTVCPPGRVGWRRKRRGVRHGALQTPGKRGETALSPRVAGAGNRIKRRGRVGEAWFHPRSERPQAGMRYAAMRERSRISSAIWIALSAAPLFRLSHARKSARPCSAARSGRMRPTST